MYFKKYFNALNKMIVSSKNELEQIPKIPSGYARSRMRTQSATVTSALRIFYLIKAKMWYHEP